jgi:hypothetical protein
MMSTPVDDAIEVAKRAFAKDHLRCSFCGKARREVKAIIVPHGIGDPAICDECVGLCVDLLARK